MPKKRGKSRNGSAGSAGAPRLNAESKLLHRFYEPLVLLHVLDSIRGDRIPRQPIIDGPDESELDLCELRRVFLDRLSYLCDFVTGGDTVTAIALQTTPQGAVFWLAANKDSREKVRPFLEGILVDIRGVGNAPLEEYRRNVEDHIFLKAVTFGIQRVKSYWQFFRKAAARCLESLSVVGSRGESPVNGGLAAWLDSFWDHKSDMPGLCDFAYEERRSKYMKELAARSKKGQVNLSNKESYARAFLDCRHYIGRLGFHRRAAKTLVTAGIRLPSLFDDFRLGFCPSSTPSLPPPPADHKTTLNGIVVRMLRNTDIEEVKFCQEALAFMDEKHQIFERFLERYQDKNFHPRVHAELIVLEHFHAKGLEFVGSDKYIGCSKPACYCCYHYICAHPGNFVRPACHNKNYINWLPPTVEHRRDMLNKMVEHIRRDALGQIKGRRIPYAWHQDSTTGISPSVDCYDQDPSCDVVMPPFNKQKALPSLVEVHQPQTPLPSVKNSDVAEDCAKKGNSNITFKANERMLPSSFRSSDTDSDSDGGVPL